MSKKAIPRAEWTGFCETFSLQHHGWLATIRTVATENLEEAPAIAAEAGRVVRDQQPLQSVRTEVADGATEIVIRVGEPPAPAHRVPEPSRLYQLERTRDHAHQGLRIDVPGGQSTLVLFRAAAQPEMLDGMAASEL